MDFLAYLSAASLGFCFPYEPYYFEMMVDINRKICNSSRNMFFIRKQILQGQILFGFTQWHESSMSISTTLCLNFKKIKINFWAACTWMSPMCRSYTNFYVGDIYIIRNIVSYTMDVSCLCHTLSYEQQCDTLV